MDGFLQVFIEVVVVGAIISSLITVFKRMLNSDNSRIE